MTERARMLTTIVAALTEFADIQRICDDSRDDCLTADEIDALLAKTGPAGSAPLIQCEIAGGQVSALSSDHPLASIFDVDVLDFDVQGEGQLDRVVNRGGGKARSVRLECRTIVAPQRHDIEGANEAISEGASHVRPTSAA